MISRAAFRHFGRRAGWVGECGSSFSIIRPASRLICAIRRHFRGHEMADYASAFGASNRCRLSVSARCLWRFSMISTRRSALWRMITAIQSTRHLVDAAAHMIRSPVAGAHSHRRFIACMIRLDAEKCRYFRRTRAPGGADFLSMRAMVAHAQQAMLPVKRRHGLSAEYRRRKGFLMNTSSRLGTRGAGRLMHA